MIHRYALKRYTPKAMTKKEKAEARKVILAINLVQQHLEKKWCSKVCSPLKRRHLGCPSCEAWSLHDLLGALKNDITDFDL